MSKIRTARDVICRIEQLGGYPVRVRGSHARCEAVVHDEEGTVIIVARATVPLHGGDMPPGTLRSIARQLTPAFGERRLRG